MLLARRHVPLSAHDAERPIVLLDEGAGQINARDECGYALRSLLTQLAAAANDARITLCHAEIPQFFAYCEDQNDDLARPSELVSATPILLRPVEDGVRQAFLDPVVKAGHEELVSEVGSIPGELQSLRCALGDVSDPSDTEDVRKAFRGVLVPVFCGWYVKILPPKSRLSFGSPANQTGRL